MNIKILEDNFFDKYGNRNNKPVLFFAPGRVNLIGEHTDYNGGYVFPCALNYGTYLCLRKRSDNIMKFRTMNFDSDEMIAYRGLFENTSRKWTNYPLGVMNEFTKKGVELSGLEMLYYGDVPNGAGLSSSASIEMVTAVALNWLFDASIPVIELIKMSQRAENEFVGMNCGIMDQFSIGMGKKYHALFLNCDTLEYEQVPLVLNEYSLVITNTNKRRGLTDSKYNERRSECDRAVEYLQAYRKIRNLGELGKEDIGILEKYIPDSTVVKRARHVISENDRVLEAVKVLRENRLERFGELMNLSHDSLKEDYEVSGKELDTLVYEGRKLPGVLGTRMTGAGFGGCTVSIVKSELVQDFISSLARSYTRTIGYVPDFYQPETGNGAGKIDL